MEEFSQLARPCILCLLYDFIVDNETRCRTAPAGNYERTFGLMILSKKELKNTTVIPQNDQSQLRGILTASVRKPSYGIMYVHPLAQCDKIDRLASTIVSLTSKCLLY